MLLFRVSLFNFKPASPLTSAFFARASDRIADIGLNDKFKIIQGISEQQNAAKIAKKHDKF